MTICKLQNIVLNSPQVIAGTQQHLDDRNFDFMGEVLLPRMFNQSVEAIFEPDQTVAQKK